jgi:hypothetical protein
MSGKMPHIAYLVVQQNISSCCKGPTISGALGFHALPTNFGVRVQQLNAALLIHRMNQFRPKFIAHSGANR